MEYLIKASAVILIFYVCYKLFLQRETFFQTNRWYFLVGLIIALLIPLVVIPIYIEYVPNTPESIMLIDPNIISAESKETPFDYLQLIYWAYNIGLVVFLGKLCIELLSLQFLFKRHNHFKNESLNFIETNTNIPPFSFFNWIVYNPSKYSKEELNHIINHEKAHAKEFHSIDIILTQLACVIFWFNPFMWLYKKELQQNLEFIADKKAQDYSKCEKSYQLILLKSCVPNHKFILTNNFYNSQIKKRIIMLHKSKSKKLNAWKYLLTLPILGLFLMSFNTEKIFIEIENPSEKDNIIQSEASAQLNNFYETIEIDKKSEPKTETKATALTNQKESSKSKPIAKATPKTNKKTSNNVIGDVSITLITKNTTDTELDKIKNQLKKKGLIVKFKGVKRNNKGEITAIKIDAKSKKSSTNYQVSSDDETIEPIKIVFDEDNNSISIGNGQSKHGENIYVYETHEGGKHKIHKSGSGSNVFVITEDEHDEEHEHEEHEHDYETKYIVKTNGKKGKVKTIKSNKKVHVISGDDDNEIIEIIVDEDGNKNEEIIIVNGKKVDITEVKDKIIVEGKSKNVWVSKDGSNEDIVTIENGDSKSNIFISTDNKKDPLIILDGKEASKKELKDLDSNKIESVIVLKDKKATEKYGDKGKDGVIIIKTKKN